MTHKNLILTEKAIKNHSKRLLKELQKDNSNITLGQAQNIFVKSLGFNNFHEIKAILNNERIINFNIYEKYLFVVLNLLLDNQEKLSFELINKFNMEEINEFLINLLFEKYNHQDFIFKADHKFKNSINKELLLLEMLKTVRGKRLFSCCSLIKLKNLDKELWDLLFHSGRESEVDYMKRLKY